MIYQLSRDIVLPGHAVLSRAGDSVELPDSEAARLMTYEPGLLRPALLTTEARATDIRSEEPEETPEAPKKRGRRVSR